MLNNDVLSITQEHNDEVEETSLLKRIALTKEFISFRDAMPASRYVATITLKGLSMRGFDNSLNMSIRVNSCRFFIPSPWRTMHC